MWTRIESVNKAQQWLIANVIRWISNFDAGLEPLEIIDATRGSDPLAKNH